MNPGKINAGNPIDWGKTSKDYSAWRPDYPDRFFDAFDREHEKLLKNIAPDLFTISHRIDAHLFQL